MLVWVEDQEVVDARTERERRAFRDEIYARIGQRAARQPRWSVPRLGIRFDPRAFAVLRKFGLRGPALAAPRSRTDPQVRRGCRRVRRHRGIADHFSLTTVPLSVTPAIEAPDAMPQPPRVAVTRIQSRTAAVGSATGR